jgi:hypothetical protein
MSTKPWRRRRRRPDATGRSSGPPRFLKLEHWMLRTAAWRSLGPAPRALYVEIAQRFNGANNGEISMSVREAADLIHVAKDTAAKAFHELEAKGFIARALCGSFNWKLRHATTWILTEHPVGDRPVTKDFARWEPEKSEPGPKRRLNCPNPRTLLRWFTENRLSAEPVLGPGAPSCTVPRSQTTAHI